MNQITTIDTDAANLPATYEAARTALAECASIDECQDWADKAAALASYARQAKDDQLERMSQRIRARAIRRAGELLKQIEPQKGGDRKSEEYQRADAQPLVSRQQAANNAGLSTHQAKQAIRVASVPQDVFDVCVEDDKPATITELADMGKKPMPVIDLKGRDPKAFNRSMHFVGMIEDYERELSGVRLDDILMELDASDTRAVKSLISKIDAIHDQIVTRI